MSLFAEIVSMAMTVFLPVQWHILFEKVTKQTSH